MAARRPVPEAATPFASWYVATGILLMLLGLFSMFAPAMAGLGYVRVLGGSLIAACIAHALAAFERSNAERVLMQVLVAAALGLGGLYLLLHPALGFGALSVSLGVCLCAAGAVDLVNYLNIRDEIASGWILASAAGALLLGTVICLVRARSSIWGLGTLLGVCLMTTGMSRVVFAHTASDVIRRPARYRSQLQRRAAKQRAARARPASRGGG